MPRKRGLYNRDSSKVIGIRIDKKLYDTFDKLSRDNHISMADLVREMLIIGLSHADKQFYDELIAKHAAEKRKQEFIKESKRIRFVCYFLKNQMRTIIDIARTHWIIDRTIPMTAISKIIDNAQALYDTFTDEERDIAKHSMEIILSFRDEGKISDMVDNMGALRYIKDGR